MNTKIKAIALVAVLALGSIGLQSVFAQEASTANETPAYGYLLAFASFIGAGVFYSASGWIKKVRRKLAGEDVELDYTKMGKSVLIGAILGVGAMIYSTWNGDTIVINNAQEFFVQIGLNTSVILLVDKWLLGTAASNSS